MQRVADVGGESVLGLLEVWFCHGGFNQIIVFIPYKWLIYFYKSFFFWGKGFSRGVSG